MRKFIRLALFAVALGLIATVARSSPRVEADPNKEYPCTPDAGAWMICVHEFRGPDAPELARQLAQVIRQRDNLPAYTYNFGEAHRKEMEEEWSKISNKVNPDGTPRKLQMKFEEERVVLIGGFKDLDAAHAALPTVKGLATPKLHLGSGKTTLDTIAVLKTNADGRGTIETVQINPFPNSFASPNPTILRDKATVKKADPILKTLNENEDYSLLKCQKPWTLAVQEYSCGQMVRTSSESTPFLETLFGTKQSDRAGRTAMQAHAMAEMLRKLKFDAYVLHTRYSSIVTIGGFASANDKDMQKLAETITQLQFHPKDPNAKLIPIQLFATPMEIPRP